MGEGGEGEREEDRMGDSETHKSNRPKESPTKREIYFIFILNEGRDELYLGLNK